MSLYIFDKDKTLRKGVLEKLDRVRADGHKISIATNQIAVAHGVITFEEAEELVEDCAAKIGGVSTWRMSPYDPKAKIHHNGKSNPSQRMMKAASLIQV